jgi:hypothetical protein
MEIDDKQPYRFSIKYKFHILKFTCVTSSLCWWVPIPVQIRAETDLQVIQLSVCNFCHHHCANISISGTTGNSPIFQNLLS